MNIPTISFDELVSERFHPTSESDPMLMLADAEIILGQDSTTQKVVVIDGREKLRNVLKDAKRDLVNVLVVEVDHEGDKLRQLKSLINIVKCR